MEFVSGQDLNICQFDDVLGSTSARRDGGCGDGLAICLSMGVGERRA